MVIVEISILNRFCMANGQALHVQFICHTKSYDEKDFVKNSPLSRYSCSAKVWPNTWIKYTTGKNKPSLVSAPIFRVTDQSTVKCHHFENWGFVWWTGKACPFSSSAIQNLIIITIFKLMALHNTLVYLWQLVHLLILVCSFQWWVLFLCLAKLYGAFSRQSCWKAKTTHFFSFGNKIYFHAKVKTV